MELWGQWQDVKQQQQQQQQLREAVMDASTLLLPIWISVTVGLIVGWSWKPRWVSLLVVALRSRSRLPWLLLPGFGARQLWMTLTALMAAPAVKDMFCSVMDWMLRSFCSWRASLLGGSSTIGAGEDATLEESERML